MTESTALKLRARDAADMDVLASCLQDSLVPVRDIAFLKKEKRFVMVFNRFKWEEVEDDEGIDRAVRLLQVDSDPQEEGIPEPDPSEDSGEDSGEELGSKKDDANFSDAEARPVYHRTHAGLVFDKVRSVSTRNIDLKDKSHFLNLLTIATWPKDIVLYFSEAGEIHLKVSEVRCHMKDLGEPWPTFARPEHVLDAEPEAG